MKSACSSQHELIPRAIGFTGKERSIILQQILFYRELGVSLEEIKTIVTAPSFDGEQTLREHRQRLLEKREQLDLLIANVDKTLAQKEGRITMTNKEKFEGFKQQMLDDNEKKYGKEIREKYGDEQVERSNRIVKNMTEEQHTEIEKLGAEVISVLIEAYATGDPAGELRAKSGRFASTMAQLLLGTATLKKHMRTLPKCMWMMRGLPHTMISISPEERRFLRDAVHIYTGMGQQSGK